MILLLLPPLITYFFYHAAFFSFMSHLYDIRPSRVIAYGVAFIVNYGLFVVISVLQVPLIANWAFIVILLMIEIKLIYRSTWSSSLLFALLGASVGLSATLTMRAVCALALSVPLAAFNNDVGADNMKALPVALGFLLAAAVWKSIDIAKNRRTLLVITTEPRTQRFLVIEIALCYLYLCLNLLLFYSPLNSILIKLWCIKTSVFVSIGAVLAIWFTYRLSSVFMQARRHDMLVHEIDADERLGDELRRTAEQDALSACFTRSYALRKLEELLARGEAFTLVFADLDRLKDVNDNHGHVYGDAYIAASAAALNDLRGSAEDFTARYGGDEFLVVLKGDVNETILAERMSVLQRELLETGREIELPFTPSISWGAAKACPDDTVETLVARADEEMYRHKRSSRSGG